jgi:hypothetical protein
LKGESPTPKLGQWYSYSWSERDENNQKVLKVASGPLLFSFSPEHGRESACLDVRYDADHPDIVGPRWFSFCRLKPIAEPEDK